MKKKELQKLLLNTAFACMACDGDIDKREVQLIKQLHQEGQVFGDIDINSELDRMWRAINLDGHQYLKDYFSNLTTTALSESDELKLIEVAIDTIKADDKVEYSEVKFFKVIRSKLKIDDEPILVKHPDFEEYLERDIISESYLAKLSDNYFEASEGLNFTELNFSDILLDSSDDT